MSPLTVIAVVGGPVLVLLMMGMMVTKRAKKKALTISPENLA